MKARKRRKGNEKEERERRKRYCCINLIIHSRLKQEETEGEKVACKFNLESCDSDGGEVTREEVRIEFDFDIIPPVFPHLQT